MQKIPLDCGQINAGRERPTEIVIYGPTYADPHPYTDLLVEELHKFNYRTWTDKLGRLCASHICLWPIEVGGQA